MLGLTYSPFSILLQIAAAKPKQLKEQVATMQTELADLAQTQTDTDRIRVDDKATYVNRCEMERGLNGVN